METENKYIDLAYEKPFRLHHYAEQINLINKYSPSKGRILEIGAGSNFVSDHLEKYNHDVVTVDVNADTNPDVHADVRDLTINDQFDVVLASEILEHIPYSDFLDVLSTLQDVTRQTCIVALPYRGMYFGAFLRVKFSVFDSNFNHELPLYIRIPYFWKEISPNDGNHYWELGAKKSLSGKSEKRYP